MCGYCEDIRLIQLLQLPQFWFDVELWQYYNFDRWLSLATLYGALTAAYQSRWLLSMRALTKLRNHVKLIIIILISVILYNEFLIYRLQSFKWPRLECPAGKDCVRLLLAADPQILGDQSERPPLRYLLNWDADRYLRKTYSSAVSYFQPEVVAFLGDIMDEGTIATTAEFNSYLKRLADIFPTTHSIKHIWIPGDNDIGGENEPIYPDKVRQFNRAFKQPDVIPIKNTVIFKVNNIIPAFPKYPTNYPILANKTNVIVSHLPLLLFPGRHTESLFAKLQPSVIFSAHKHAAFHLETNLESMLVSKVMAQSPQSLNQVVRIRYKADEYHEFLVPACSYRLNAPHMGYGIALIDNDKNIQYAILWSPRRFEQLHTYIIVLIAMILYTFMFSFYKIYGVMCRSKIQYSKV